MGGYLSFDASVKIHASGKYSNTKSDKTGVGGYVGYLRHLDRADDKKDGIELGHSNTNIDPDYTLDNESYYKDENGEWKPTEHASDMVEAVDRRINYAKEHGARIYYGGKNDTCIIRPLLLQLDSEAIKGHEDEWVDDLVSLAEEHFGSDNIVGLSIHYDEDNPHIHLVFVPCYKTVNKNGELKCAVSQTKFFKSPESLAAMHKVMRNELREKGYNVEIENKPIEEQPNSYMDEDGKWHKGNPLTPDQLKELTNRKINLKTKEIDIAMAKKEIETREEALRQDELALQNKKRKMDAQEEDLRDQLGNIRMQRRRLEEQEDELDREREELDKAREEEQEEKDSYEKFLNYCKQIKTSEKHTAYDYIKQWEKKYKDHQADIRARKNNMMDIGDQYDQLHSSYNEPGARNRHDTESEGFSL